MTLINTIGDNLMYVAVYFGLFFAIFFFYTYIENIKKLKNPKPKRNYDLTIIVPAFNEGKNIAKSISSLLKLEYPKNLLKILVIDDGSKDDTYKIAKEFEKKYDNVKVFTKENGGKGSAMNFGLKKVNTELVVTMDADSFVKKDALMKMIGYFNNPKVMSVTPSMKIHKPKNFWERIQALEYLFGIYLRKTFSYVNSIQVTPGPFSIFRKEFFEKHGGYDEHNMTEDIEIAYRMHKNNYLIENSVDAEVFTVPPKNFKELFDQRVRWYLGFIKNTVNYKSFFSPKYGHLGMIMLPSAFIGVFLATFVLLYIGYSYISQQISTFWQWYIINFDLKQIFSWKFDIFYYNFDAVVLLGFFLVGLTLLTVFLARKNSKDKTPKRKFALSLIYFMLFYGIFYSFWWMTAFYYKVTNKKIIWAGKEL